MQTTINAVELKALLKVAVTEVLEERRDLLQSVIEDSLEDMALIRAIESGAQSEHVSREEVFRALAGAV
jgi:hypothetical protein